MVDHLAIDVVVGDRPEILGCRINTSAPGAAERVKPGYARWERRMGTIRSAGGVGMAVSRRQPQIRQQRTSAVRDVVGCMAISVSQANQVGHERRGIRAVRYRGVTAVLQNNQKHMGRRRSLQSERIENRRFGPNIGDLLAGTSQHQ